VNEITFSDGFTVTLNAISNQNTISCKDSIRK